VAQFTVYRNKSARTKAAFPFLVDVQSDLLEPLQTRVVIPLAKPVGLAKRPLSHLMPLLKFERETYVLVTPQLAGIAVSDLGAAAGSLAHERQTILGAMDFLLSGF
jgi:toxin CcdB